MIQVDLVPPILQAASQTTLSGVRNEACRCELNGLVLTILAIKHTLPEKLLGIVPLSKHC